MNIECEIYKIKFNHFSNNYKLIFKQFDSDNFCEIEVHSYDAKNIALSKENIISSRLKTYDLLIDILFKYVIKVEKMIIAKKNDVILANIYLSKEDETIIIGANFIDSIIIAQKTFSPILINHSLFSNDKNLFYNNEKYIIKSNMNNVLTKFDKIRKLNKTLDDLIISEKYEHAAIVRDRIEKILKYNKAKQ